MSESKFTEFREMLRDFLGQAQLVDDIDPWGDTDYYQIVSRSYTDGDETKYLAVPIPTWKKFYKNSYELFDGEIGYSTLRFSIAYEISQEKEYPFSEDVLDQLLARISDHIRFHYETVLEALVPLSNISMSVDKELLLGAAHLCPGGPNSALHKQINRPDAWDNIQELADNCYLRTTTTGDNSSRIRQVEQKTRDALAILRFVVDVPRGPEPEGKNSNPAEMVDVWGENKRTVFYILDSAPDENSAFNIGVGSAFAIWDKKLQDLQESSGLDHINFHFNRPESLISSRIIQAIQIYDSAIRSGQDWMALYRYVVCTECAIPVTAQKHDEFARRVEQTIYYGGHFRGGDKLPRFDGESNLEYWKRFVSHTLQGVEEFYKDRNRILHGSMANAPSVQITPEKLRKIRVIAYNVIRTVARLAIEFDWYSLPDGKKWYQNPIPSPTFFGDAE